MTVGYMIGNILPFILMGGILLFRQISSLGSRSAILYYIIRKATGTFYSCALFLIFSLQIAVIFSMSRVNFGISAQGMEAFTLQITWTISAMMLLPLLYELYPLEFFMEQIDVEDHQVTYLEGKGLLFRFDEDLHVVLYFVCWILSFYPFISSLSNMFGPNQVSDNPGSVISKDDFGIIQDICFQGVDQSSIPSDREGRIMKGFLTATWLFVYSLSIIKLIIKSFGFSEHNKFRRLRPSFRPVLAVLFMISILFFSISQLWTYMRLRSAQAAMVESFEEDDTDTEWTFGQVAAVTAYMPVVVEIISVLWALWRNRRGSKAKPLM